jgi:prolyl oligopeptidase
VERDAGQGEVLDYRNNWGDNPQLIPRRMPRMTLPTARIDIVRDTYFGTTVQDPYRWMEDWKGEELQAWVKAQAAYSQWVLDTLPERDALATQIAQLNDASPTLANLQLAGGRAFYLRRDLGESLPKLIVRATVDASEAVLFNPNTLGTAVHTAIDWYSPSPDGRRVAIGTSQGGSERSSLQVIDVDTQTLYDLGIPGTIFNAVMWLDDGSSFTYHRLREPAAGVPETERYFDSCTYLHQLGDDPAHDLKVFGRDVSVGIAIAHADLPGIYFTPGSDWIIGVVVHRVFDQVSLYAAPRSALLDPTTTPWTRIADVTDAVAGLGAIVDPLSSTPDRPVFSGSRSFPALEKLDTDLQGEAGCPSQTNPSPGAGGC